MCYHEYEHMSTKRLQVLIPAALDARIQKAAQRSRMSKGQWVRLAVERALAENRGAGDALDRLARLGAPTGDIEAMLAEIDAGRG
jgi:hypothetical protein